VGITDFINIVFTQPIFNGLMLLYQLFGDFGLSIIVLTIVIRLILFPLTLQQLKSTKATQALQPQIAEIRKKYAKDQQGQAMAMQALYKEYGINPLAGCLPLFIQLPILYGLFFAFRAVLDDFSIKGDNALHAQGLQRLNGFIYPFLPHFTHFPNINLNWFTFLNHAWFISLGSADPTHILPILAGLATFIQLRMAQPKTTSKATDAMSQQMKMMQYIMPLMTVIFAWTFPAGLALYWTTSAIFSMVQQYFVTGWGALLTVPDFIGGNTSNKSNSNGNGKSYTGDQRKETRLLARVNEEEREPTTGNAVGSKMRTTPHGNGSSPGRRQRSSASARRRGNAPKRKVPRS
jgi:YidC/Oxa1 family membrane protein insertase